MNNKKVIKASFFHSPEYGGIEFLKQALVFVSSDGIISKVIRQDDEDYLELLDKHSKDNHFFDFKDKILLPGFIDLHIHAPQWPQAGLALDDELSYWLNNFTFPLESKYKDINYAREVYTDLVKTLLANGTTSAMYFGTIHNESTCCWYTLNSGLRASAKQIALAATTCSNGPPCAPGKIILLIFTAISSLLVRIIPPRGPLNVLCVVDVTTSA